jgi:hypothetical protein
VRSDVFVGKVPGLDQGLVKAAYGELALKLDARAEKHGDAYGELRLRYGQDGPQRRLLVDLREAYVNLYAGPLDLRLGQQIIVWGRADAFNPTNSFMPLDFRGRSPIEDDRRVGNVGARAFVQTGPFVRIEGVWLPLYVPTEYPPFELEPFITLGEPDYPAPELENGTLGARVHLELPAFEGSVSYVHGHAPLPGLGLVDYTVGEDPPEVRIARTAYTQHVIGIDGSTAVGELFAVRAEAAYRHPIDSAEHVHAARPDVHYVLGADRAFGPVSVIAQYMGRVVLDFQREDGPEDPIEPEALVRFMEPLPRSLELTITSSIEAELAQRNQVLFSQTARVQHLMSLRIEWLTLHEALSLSTLGMLNFTTREWLVFPKAGYKISDAMTVYAGAEVYVGPSGTLLDLIDHELTAGYAELRYSF